MIRLNRPGWCNWVSSTRAWQVSLAPEHGLSTTTPGCLITDSHEIFTYDERRQGFIDTWAAPQIEPARSPGQCSSMPALGFHFLSQQKERCEGSWPGWRTSMKVAAAMPCFSLWWHSKGEQAKVMIYEEIKQPQVADLEPSFVHRNKGTKEGWMETNLCVWPHCSALYICQSHFHAMTISGGQN